MKKIVIILIGLILVSCATQRPGPSVEAPSVDTPIPPTRTPLARWPENYHFCRPKDDGSGTADCVSIASDEEWLALNPIAGERLVPWPEGMELPPLPEGFELEYLLDQSIGENIWTIVETE